MTLNFQAPPKGPMHNYNPDYFDDSYDYGGYNRFDRDGGMDRGRRGGPPRGGGRMGRGGRGGKIKSVIFESYSFLIVNLCSV